MSEHETSILRETIRQFLKLELVATPVNYEVQAAASYAGYVLERITYPAADSDTVPAFLVIPDGDGPFPAVMVHHQHAGQRHLGKSEVVGLAGDPLQAFGPELAKRRWVVLAPDSICFEDRRKHTAGIQPHHGDDHQHFIEMGSRLTQGDSLMRKLLADASSGLSLLTAHPKVDARKIGICGHSYGGNTVLFQAAMEHRIAFAVSSGALCSYAYKREHDIALELSLIIPEFAAHWDLHHLLECIAPHPLLIVSADDDPYSKNAGDVIDRAKPNNHVRHFRDRGGHALTPQRFNFILSFLSDCIT